jgi:hypothetical protein
MPHCEVGTENGSPTKIHYEDTHVLGRPTKDRRAHSRRARHVGPHPSDRGNGRPVARSDRRRPSRALEGGPHNIGRTRPDQLNQALLDFLNEPARAIAGSASSRADSIQ